MSITYPETHDAISKCGTDASNRSQSIATIQIDLLFILNGEQKEIIIFIESLRLLWFISSQRNISPRSVAVSSKTQDKGRRVVTIEINSGGKRAAERLLGFFNLLRH